jgi:hypothetical protein
MAAIPSRVKLGLRIAVQRVEKVRALIDQRAVS